MLAARGGHAKAVQVLIEAGANVNLRNQVAIFLIPQIAKYYYYLHSHQNQESGLMLAARHGPGDVLVADLDFWYLDLFAESDRYIETVEALIEAGADISLKNEVRC